jgi:hypothetical protein
MLMLLIPRCLVPVTRRNQWITLFRNDFHAFDVSTMGSIVGSLQQSDDYLSLDWGGLYIIPNEDGEDSEETSKHCLHNIGSGRITVPSWNSQQGLYHDTIPGHNRMQNLEALDFNFTG